jgi:hypothetical protein
MVIKTDQLMETIPIFLKQNNGLLYARNEFLVDSETWTN